MDLSRQLHEALTKESLIQKSKGVQSKVTTEQLKAMTEHFRYADMHLCCYETKPLEGNKYIKQKESCPPATFYFPCLLEKLVTTLYYKKSTIGVQKFHVDDKLSNEISVSSVTLHMSQK